MTTKILILAANPKDTSRLRLDEEVREIENGFQRAQKRESFTIKAQWATRIQDVRRAMLDFCPNIVHFCGHGKGEAGIQFEDDLGESHLVSAEALAGFFKLFAEDVQCVVLNACYSEVQANAIAQHIPSVIGMSDEIGDKTAIEFAVAFYDALGAGRTVKFAYELACNAIQMAGIPSSEGQGVGMPEHLIPVLFTKATEGVSEPLPDSSLVQPEVPKQPQSIQIDKKEIPLNLHNKIVEFLMSLPNIQDKNERRALIFSASLDKALEHQVVFDGSTVQCFQLLVHTLVSYGKQKNGRDPLIALLETAKNKVGQDRKAVCEKLIHQVQTSKHPVIEMPADQDVTKPIFDFSDYIAERTQNFTGREWVFAEIDAWLAKPDAPHYFIITGEPGIGKTALAGRLSQIRQFDATHFCIARQADTIDSLNFVRSISHQLNRIEGFAQSILKEKNVRIDVHISNVREVQGNVIGVQIENLLSGAESAAIAFSRVVANPLRQLYADGFNRQIVIMVDALDEAVRQPGAETIVTLLENAQSLPEQIRFLLTTRPDADVLRHFEDLKLPYLLINAGREENQKDIREYIGQRVAASDVLQTRLSEQHTPEEVFVERVATASQGNFLYVTMLLRAVAEGTQLFETLDDLPDGLDGIYREFLRTRTVGENRKDWQMRYRPLLGVLAAAQAPLTAEQLAKFSGLNEQKVDDLLLDVRQFLAPGSWKQGQYQLYHQSLPDFFQHKERAKEFWIDLLPFHHQIVAAYQKQYSGYWEQCDLYGFRYLPVHLMRAGQPENLRELMFSFEWLQAKLTATDINTLLADYPYLKEAKTNMPCVSCNRRSDCPHISWLKM